MNTHINVSAVVSDELAPRSTRYEFTLYAMPTSEGEHPVIERKFIIDVPHTDDEGTDVWVMTRDRDCIVAVGDTPADGFATFTPVQSTSTGVHPSERDLPDGDDRDGE